MAVNNFAPAEYGGYVLGVNGSGGGGGDDMFIVNDVYDPNAGTHTLDKHGRKSLTLQLRKRNLLCVLL